MNTSNESVYDVAIKPELLNKARLHLKWLAILSFGIQIASTWNNMNQDGM